MSGFILEVFPDLGRLLSRPVGEIFGTSSAAGNYVRDLPFSHCRSIVLLGIKVVRVIPDTAKGLSLLLHGRVFLQISVPPDELIVGISQDSIILASCGQAKAKDQQQQRPRGFVAHDGVLKSVSFLILTENENNMRTVYKGGLINHPYQFPKT